MKTGSNHPNWSAESWQSKPVTQLPEYPNPEARNDALKRLSELPPLVTSWEVESLKNKLAGAATGKLFLLQGGDCSEGFSDCRSDIIASKLKVLLRMSLVLTQGCKKKIILVGRFAGQYAKPRSTSTETRDGVTLPSYRGDMVNSRQFAESQRIPDPERLLRSYERSALTLNFIRSLVDGGFADLHHPEYWDLDFVSHSSRSKNYNETVDSIGESIKFMETIVGVPIGEFNRTDFFTSHEGLNLFYEQAQTRQVPRRTGWYNLSTHFPWIGDRTRSIQGAHIEYFRGIANPIGIKIGPSINPEELLELIECLNPENQPGKLAIIHRFGANHIAECLPPLLKAVKDSGKTVVWCCDPMHGNTETTKGGIKTRDFNKILSELEQAFQLHKNEDSILGGVHLELTGDHVTECTGGARGLTEADLTQAYKTLVDPRLNGEQALEIAFLICDCMKRNSK